MQQKLQYFFKKETEKDIKKCKDSLSSWTGKTNVVKMALLPKLILYITNTIKIPTAFLTIPYRSGGYSK